MFHRAKGRVFYSPVGLGR